MSRKTKPTEKKHTPFLTMVNGEAVISLDLSWGYSQACNQGKAEAYSLIRYQTEHTQQAGLLQCYVLGLMNQINRDSDAVHGFIVGLFSELDSLIRQAYCNTNCLEQIKANRFDDAGASPLSYRGGEV